MKEFFRKIFKKMGDEFFTVPNMLSILRILLIPVIVYVYVFGDHIENNHLIAAGLIVFSGLTDVVDGFIARKFNMITDFGKFLDPLADKLTQLTVIACLITKFKMMWIPFIVLAIKEVTALLAKLVIYKKKNRVDGAEWHGKASTVLIVTTLGIHLLFPEIAPLLSNILIIACTLLMAFSGTMYMIDNVRIMKDEK